MARFSRSISLMVDVMRCVSEDPMTEAQISDRTRVYDIDVWKAQNVKIRTCI